MREDARPLEISQSHIPGREELRGQGLTKAATAGVVAPPH